MKRLLLLVIVALLSVVVLGCATAAPQATQTQIREFQTREFDADTKTVLKACLNALQDDGYIVKNAVSDLGLLSATKQVDVQSTGEAVVAVLFAGGNARFKKNSETEVTVDLCHADDTALVVDDLHAEVCANFALRAEIAHRAGELGTLGGFFRCYVRLIHTFA